MQGQTTEALLR